MMSNSLSARVAKIRLDQGDKVLPPFKRCQHKMDRLRELRRTVEVERVKKISPAPAGHSERIFSYYFDRDYVPVRTDADGPYDDLYQDRDPRSY